ncbi:MAG: DUF2853 family protein, partial [Maribacter sp.]|nr:DUF2853 family protein [Maribacter sp.]
MIFGRDISELVRVRRNFVEKKLRVMDRESTMNVIDKVVDKMSGILMKRRPTFYYLVQQELT